MINLFRDSNFILYKICLYWNEILEKLKRENCLYEFKSNMKKLTIIGFFCFNPKILNTNTHLSIDMIPNPNLNLNLKSNSNLSNQTSNTNPKIKSNSNSSDDLSNLHIMNHSETAIYFHHVIDNSSNHFTKTVKESYNFFKKFGLLISPVERIAYNINNIDDYIKIINSLFDEVVTNFLNNQEAGAVS